MSDKYLLSSSTFVLDREDEDVILIMNKLVTLPCLVHQSVEFETIVINLYGYAEVSVCAGCAEQEG